MEADWHRPAPRQYRKRISPILPVTGSHKSSFKQFVKPPLRSRRSRKKSPHLEVDRDVHVEDLQAGLHDKLQATGHFSETLPIRNLLQSDRQPLVGSSSSSYTKDLGETILELILVYGHSATAMCNRKDSPDCRQSQLALLPIQLPMPNLSRHRIGP